MKRNIEKMLKRKISTLLTDFSSTSIYNRYEKYNLNKQAKILAHRFRLSKREAKELIKLLTKRY